MHNQPDDQRPPSYYGTEDYRCHYLQGNYYCFSLTYKHDDNIEQAKHMHGYVIRSTDKLSEVEYLSPCPPSSETTYMTPLIAVLIAVYVPMLVMGLFYGPYLLSQAIFSPDLYSQYLSEYPTESDGINIDTQWLVNFELDDTWNL